MRVSHTLSVWLRSLATTLALIAVSWLLVQQVCHLQLLDVQTGSMVPTFHPADALIVKRSQSVPKVGQIVSYHSSRNPNELVTHRVVALASNRFQTKGDHVTSLDPPVGTNLLRGRVVLIMPGLGHVLRWFRSVPGLILTVYVPALAIIIFELRRLERHYRQLEPYRLSDRQMV